MAITQKTIPHIFRNKYLKNSSGGATNVGGTSSGGISHTHSNKSVLDSITNEDINSWKNKLDKTIWDKAFYFDTSNNLRVKLNLVGDKEVAAYGAGYTGGGSGGVVTIVDNLISTATDCALSANQGRILKSLIDTNIGGVSSWNDLTDKPTSFNPAAHTHTISNITNLQTTLDDKANNTTVTAHTANTTAHITATERTNWNGVVNNWNKAFYFDTSNNLRVKLNLVGDKEVAAYGAGDTGGAGAITIIDSLNSTATDAALSANQGRILKSLIDNNTGGVSSWNDLTDKPNWIGSSKPLYSWSEITSKPTTLAGYGISSGAGSGIDADKLDGYQGSEYLRSFWSGANANDIPETSQVTFTYANNAPFNGVLADFSIRRYGIQFNTDYYSDTQLAYRRHAPSSDGGTGSWQYLARTTDNVASATKIRTARYIWGHYFDGTDNIEGAFKSITGRGNVDVQKLLTDANSPYGLITSISSNGAATLQVQRENNAAETFSLFLNPKGGQVHVGTWSGTQKLCVGGWVATQGTSGWYSEDFGGGIHMTDTTYVKVSHNKKFYVSNSDYDAINNVGGYYSGKNNSVNDTWANALNPTSAVYNCPNNHSVNSWTYRNMLGWMDVVIGQGYITRYSIGSYRRYGDWGGIALTVGNNDAGTSGHQLKVGGNGNMLWSGNFVATGEVTAYGSSDRRLKKGIKSITNSIGLLNKLNPVTFQWNKKAKELNSTKDDRNNYGLIAQEVEEVLPELIHPIYDKYKSVDYEQLIPILISAIKELKDEIDSIKETN